MPRKSLSGVHVRPATELDYDQIEKFLDHQARTQAFGYCFSEGELKRRLSKWTGFKITDFQLAFESEKIVGCLAPWSPFEAKRNVLEKIPLHYQLYRPFISMPKAGEALRPIYLTHLEIHHELPEKRRGQIFRMLVDRVQWPKSAHMLSFCDYAHNRFALSLGGHILNQVPMKLYTVAATGAQPRFPETETREPGFEIALV